MTPTYELSDKFLVYAPDGTITFDSRIMSQRIHLSGVVDLAGRTTSPAPGGGVILNPSAGVYIPLNKTFLKPPYVLSASRKFAADDSGEEFPSNRVYPPRLLYREGVGFSNLNYLKGAFTNAQTNRVFIGNASSTGDNITGFYRGEKRCWYAVFENEVA